MRQRRRSKEEHARLGHEFYEGQIRTQVEAGNHGRIVAIDVDTGAYELGDDVLSACDKLYAHHPNAQPWCERIGFPYVVRFGGCVLSGDRQ